jgi:hypothetical protein
MPPPSSDAGQQRWRTFDHDNRVRAAVVDPAALALRAAITGMQGSAGQFDDARALVGTRCDASVTATRLPGLGVVLSSTSGESVACAEAPPSAIAAS